ncbi:MAG: hypothetical protein QM784_02790 [Polyangiaceae bacterium]
MVLEREPEHRAALNALARIYTEQSETAELAEILATLVRISAGEERIAHALRLADARSALGDASAAADALRVALAVDERNDAIRQRLRRLYEEQNDWAKVAELLISQVAVTDSVGEQVKLLREASSMRADRLGDLVSAAGILERASALVPEIVSCCCYYATPTTSLVAGIVRRRLSNGSSPPTVGAARRSSATSIAAWVRLT